MANSEPRFSMIWAGDRSTPNTPAQSVAVNYSCPLRWSTVQLQASAEMIKWQHSEAICVSVVAYGQFDAPNEERSHDP
jgi:hypothetical protein